ncbi:MAG: hypothetical protein R3E79_45790 [Caldilineaceae bacterium]
MTTQAAAASTRPTAQRAASAAALARHPHRHLPATWPATPARPPIR